MIFSFFLNISKLFTMIQLCILLKFFFRGAVTETCFKKATGGSFADVSEQHFLDCGYKKYGANGCNGAALAAYSRYWAENKLGIAHEDQYGYKKSANNYQCPANLSGFKFGAQITEAYYTYRGTEELMKELVYKHGAVITAVQVNFYVMNLISISLIVNNYIFTIKLEALIIC